MISALVAIFVLTIAFGLFFAPLLIAMHRRHRHALHIVLMNFLLSWTIVGWFAALIWSLSPEGYRRPVDSDAIGRAA